MTSYDVLFEGWWHRNQPVSETAISLLCENLPQTLPGEYLQLLQWSNGGEGESRGYYYTFWKAEEILRFNVDYRVQEFLPDAVAFGDDGPNLLVLDKSGRVCRTPFGYPFDDLLKPVAKNFTDFVLAIGNSD